MRQRMFMIPTLAPLVLLACAAEKTTRPATAPATMPTTTSAPAHDPAVVRLLDDLEKAGEKHATLRADIDYHVEMRQIGDSETRSGYVVCQIQTPESPAKFRVHFDTLRQGGGPEFADKVDYAFDGMWLTAKKHRIKQMTRYQVAAPGERIEPFKLGKGPFPLPFGQSSQEVLRCFDVTTRPAGKGEPPETDYLELITRRRFRKQMDLRRLEMWVDRRKHLPVKIISADRNKNVTTVVFRNIRTGMKLSEKMFHMPRPIGWQYHVEPLAEPRRLGP